MKLVSGNCKYCKFEFQVHFGNPSNWGRLLRIVNIFIEENDWKPFLYLEELNTHTYSWTCSTPIMVLNFSNFLLLRAFVNMFFSWDLHYINSTNFLLPTNEEIFYVNVFHSMVALGIFNNAASTFAFTIDRNFSYIYFKLLKKGFHKDLAFGRCIEFGIHCRQ